MADKIHGKKKDWPHFNTMYVSSEAYGEGYDRIFGKKDEDGEKVNETRRRRKVQKARRKAKKTRRA